VKKCKVNVINRIFNTGSTDYSFCFNWLIFQSS